MRLGIAVTVAVVYLAVIVTVAYATVASWK